jgi:glutaredoxin/glutathione-dependent peroxiredoxin
MTIKPGETLPETTFMTMTADGPAPKTTGDVFSGRTVALFAVPGAFTPTCSAKHLPGFIGKAGELKAKGVDAIACTAVNDVFVMDAWAKAEGAEGIEMLADGNAAFAKSLGLDMDGSRFGMGPRSQRYVMLVRDGTVEKLFVEEPGDFKVSSAEHLLSEL